MAEAKLTHLAPGSIGLVIFDCDGVLIDSERLAVKVDVLVLRELGWPLSEVEVVERFVGRSDRDTQAAQPDRGQQAPGSKCADTRPRVASLRRGYPILRSLRHGGFSHGSRASMPQPMGTSNWLPSWLTHGSGAVLAQSPRSSRLSATRERDSQLAGKLRWRSVTRVSAHERERAP